MKIDKSRFDAAELAQWHALIAKGMVDPEAGEEEMEGEMPPFPPKKPAKKAEFEGEGYEEDEEDEDFGKKCKTRKSADYVLAAALERLESLEKSAEMKECYDIAKKYAALGEDEDEMANTIYEMKKSNYDNFTAYINALDKSLDLIEKSGLFGEIGKSAGGYASATGAVAKAEAKAEAIMESDPSVDYDTALAKAWDDPAIMAEYDAEFMA